MQRGQILPREGSGQSHHRRPQAAMHVGDLPADQATNEDIARAPNGTREPEDLVALRVAPPAPAYRSRRHGLREVGNWSASTFENDAVAADESEGGLGRHKAALAFVRRHGVVLEGARGPVPNLAEAVATGPIRGSWWGHAK